MIRTGLFGFLGVVALAACGSEESSPNPSEYRLVEVERLGTVDGEVTFTFPVAVWEEPDRVLVLEASPARLIGISKDGSDVEEIARPGTGPGELSRPMEMGGYDNIIWIADGSGRRLELLDSRGSSLERIQFVIAPDSGGLPSFPRAPLRGGRILAGPGYTPISPVARGAVSHDTWFVADRQGSVLDTVYRRTQPATDFFIAELGGQRFAVGGHPIMERPLPAIFPDGTGMAVVERWISEGSAPDTFWIRIWNGQGELEREVPVSYQPVSAEGWREKHREAMESRLSDDDDPALDSRLDAMSDRSHYPPVSDFRVGQDGRLLIRREESRPDSVRWDVFTRSGEREASFTLPLPSRVLSSVQNAVWVLERDELDVPYLVKYELRVPN